MRRPSAGTVTPRTPPAVWSCRRSGPGQEPHASYKAQRSSLLSLPSGAVRVGVSPGALEGQSPRRGGHQLVDRVGTPRTLLVGAYGGGGLAQRRGEVPTALVG